MAERRDEPAEDTSFLYDVRARLGEAAHSGASLEVILTVRGRIEPVPGKRGERWRLRTPSGHVITFRPEFVVAFNRAVSAESQRVAADAR
jgi:hypothetical protein